MQDSEPDSVAQNQRGFTVTASPLNPVKLELGIILLVGVLLLLSVSNFMDSNILQIGILLLYGLISMSWIIYRTRRLLRQPHP